MRKPLLLITCLCTLLASAADDPVERWAKAVGGRERLASLHVLYREAAVQYGGLEGTLKVWHTADGKYRKEEQVGPYSIVETFDGVSGSVQQGTAPPHPMSPEELAVSTSKRFANSNSIFFVFFPERRHGSIAVEGDTVVLKPEGGVEWRVTLDPQTSLPTKMVHVEGGQTVTAQLVSYETVDGLTLEKEIHRSTGSGPGAVIRFTKTVINPSVDPSLFSLATAK